MGYLLRNTAFSLLLVVAATSCAGRHLEEAGPQDRMLRYDTDVFTRAHVDVSPDGTQLVFDAVGHLYQVPVAGGTGRQLTHGKSWNMQPRFSPDGRRIAFISDRGGAFERWAADADGSDPIEFPGVYEELQKTDQIWTAQGEIFSVDDMGGDFVSWAWRSPQSRRLLQTTPRQSLAATGAWSPGGNTHYFGGYGLHAQDAGSASPVPLLKGPQDTDYFFKLRLSRDGSVLAYWKKTGESIPHAGKHEECTLHAYHLAGRQDVAFSASITPCYTNGKGDYDLPDYAILPDGLSVIANVHGKFKAFDTKTGAHRDLPVVAPVHRAVATPSRVERHEASPSDVVRSRVIRWPSASTAHSTIIFNAFSRIYAKEAASGRIRRLVDGAQSEFAPAISPDGNLVAYSTWSDLGGGHIMVVAVSGGIGRQVTREPGKYINPVWSHDGRTLAFISDEDGAAHKGLPSEGLAAVTAHGPKRGMWLKFASVEDPAKERYVTEVTPLHWQIRRYYPVPSFLPGDRRIAIPTNLSEGSPDLAIMSIGVDGTDKRHHLSLPNIDEAVIAPDGRHLAIVAKGQLQVVSIDLEGPARIGRIGADEGRSVPGVDPVHVSWTSSDELVWAEGRDIRQLKLDQAEPGTLSTMDVSLPRDIPSGCVAFANARIVTLAAQGVLENATLLACRNRITAIGETQNVEIPAGTSVVDVKGATIIPGLVDSHAHVHSVGFEIWPSQDVWYVANLAHGVTTVFDPQAPVLDALGRAEMVEIGDAVGPRVYSSGPMIFGRDYDVFSNSHQRIATEEDARQVVASRSRYGADPVKSYEELNRRRRQLLAAAARKLGVAVTSHAAGFEHAVTNPIDGISMEHSLSIARNIEIHDDIHKLIAGSGVNYTIEFIGAARYPINTLEPKLNRLMPNVMLHRFESEEDLGSIFVPHQIQDARSLARVFELGGIPSISSHGSFVPGLSMHHDLWALVDTGGMKPEDALRVASLNGAIKIGMAKQLGSIEIGKLADIVILNSNPLDDIKNSTDIRFIVKGGVVYDGPTMTRLYPGYQPLAPWPWQSDEDRKRLGVEPPVLEAKRH